VRKLKKTGRKIGQKKKSWGELTFFLLYLEIYLCCCRKEIINSRWEPIFSQ
jgi:hypothetical protein